MNDYSSTCEIAIEWVKGDDIAYITAYNNSKLKGKLLKYANSNDDCKIVVENPDGSILAHVPINWIKVSPPKKMSEENKIKAAERMRNLHQKG